VIEQLSIRGAAGSLLWGYRDVAELGAWVVIRALPTDQKRSKPSEKLKADKRTPKGWELLARVRRVEAFQIRQKPLYFTAPRRGGFWTFPILESPEVKDGILRALLGQPER